MHHLNLESLARLVDEAPGVDEAAHLRDCLLCRRELDALREQTAALSGLTLLEPAAGAWEAIESRLLEEGLLSSRAPAPAPRRLRWPALRIAASVALFLTGGLAGALLWDRAPGSAMEPLASDSSAAQVVQPGGEILPQHDQLAAAPVAPVESRPGADGAVRLTGGGEPVRPAPRRAAAPVSRAVRQAEQELAEAEMAYLAALRRYAELADPASGADPVTRLEALDRLVEMSALALERSPDDAQLNGYHLAALSERDALRRQIRQAAQTTWF